MPRIVKHTLMAGPKPAHRRFRDLEGRTVGRLTVVGYAGKQGVHHKWDCECSCGATTQVFSGSLMAGTTRSCGCLQHEMVTVHGGWEDPLYNAWAGMLRRCASTKFKHFDSWGGRGISVCAEFQDFLAYKGYIEKTLGPKPSPMHSLDRVDNDGNYEPGNLRWASPAEQGRNTRKTALMSLCGVEVPLITAAEIFGINYRTLRSRFLMYGEPLAAALVRRKRGKHNESSPIGIGRHYGVDHALAYMLFGESVSGSVYCAPGML